jgi:hypothetical protein
MAKATATKKASTRKAAPRKSSAKKGASKKATPRKWSARVNETSDAMDLKEGVFKSDDPKKIARSLKRSATQSNRRKTTPFQSAMSMLNFYINRGGDNLTATHRKTLEEAKEVLRELFGKDEK